MICHLGSGSPPVSLYHIQVDEGRGDRHGLVDSPSRLCLSMSKGEIMTYDWDGQRTRRLIAFKLITAVAVGISVPLAVTLWTYIG